MEAKSVSLVQGKRVQKNVTEKRNSIQNSGGKNNNKILEYDTEAESRMWGEV